jgi:hypothetical protein
MHCSGGAAESSTRRTPKYQRLAKGLGRRRLLLIPASLLLLALMMVRVEVLTVSSTPAGTHPPRPPRAA